MQSTVGGDQRYIQRYSQLYVQGVNQTELVSSCPGAEEKIGRGVALDRSSDKFVKLRLDTAGLKFASPVQSAQRGQNLGIDVSWCMQPVACDPPAHGTTQLVVQQKINKRGGINHQLSHDEWEPRRVQRRAPPTHAREARSLTA